MARLNIELTDDNATYLAAQSVRAGLNKTTLTNQALALHKVYTEAIHDHAAVLVRDPDTGQLSEIKLI
jgi:hypothetical protein